MAAIYFFPAWIWWLIYSILFLTTLLVLKLWGHRIHKHPIWLYSVMSVAVGSLFVHRLMKSRDSLGTTLAGVWLLFVVLALVFSLLDARERSVR